MLPSLQKTFGKPQLIWSLLIFLTCLFVYLANGETVSSTDNISSSLLAFNWLDNHTLNFDLLRGTRHIQINGVPRHYLTEAPNGHLTSTYPIGNAIVTFPLYALFYLHLKLQAFFQTGVIESGLLNLADPGFNVDRKTYEKLAASIVAALSVVIFYLAVRLKFSQNTAILTSFIFAFATTTWAISSQGLWQHGSANLLMVSIILCLLKANRSLGTQRRILLVVAGFLCGLLPGTRTSSLLYAVAIVLYVLLVYRREAMFFLLGLPAVLFNASWNLYYFGFSLRNVLVGGYSSMATQGSFTEKFYIWTPQQFREGFWGLLFSPSRGWLVFSPIVLFAIPGIYYLFKRVIKFKHRTDEWLIASLVLAAFTIFLQYCFFTVWGGGVCYGPRYMTDLLPIACFLIAYFVEREFFTALRLQWQSKLIALLFAMVLSYSVFTQIVGVFGVTNWDNIPYVAEHRVWQWQDSQIERHTRSLLHLISPPMEKPVQYKRNLQGQILTVKDEQNQELKNLVATPWQARILQADLRNLGRSPWFAYQTGIMRGLTEVRVQFLDTNQQVVETGQTARLYFTSSVEQGQVGTAIGSVEFPIQPGQYMMIFYLVARGLGEMPDALEKPLYQVPVLVQ
jgi:hypothetical protein